MSYRWYQFDPHKSFISLPILWIVISLFILVACAVSAVIVYQGNLVFDFSYIGFNKFLTIFRVPLSITALVIPIVALLAANHRSEQTKAQIESSTKQNIFANYYSHIDEFDKYMTSLSSGGGGAPPVVHHRMLHRYLFPNAKHGDYSIDLDVIEKINYSFSNIKNNIKSLNNTNMWAPPLYEISHELDVLGAKLSIGWRNGGNGTPLEQDSKRVVIVGKILQIHFRDVIINPAKYLISVIEFDQFASMPQSLIDVAEINIHLLPGQNIDPNNITPLSINLFPVDG